MAMDRDLYLDTFGNVEKFKAGGLPTSTTCWNAALPQTAFKGWWLDPKGKDFGANAKYFKHDIAEAKKLMAAAGFANGLTVTSNQIGRTGLRRRSTRSTSRSSKAWPREAGFKFDKKPAGLRHQLDARVPRQQGLLRWHRLPPHALSRRPGRRPVLSAYNKDGGIYYGFDPDGKGTPKGHPSPATRPAKT